MSRMPASLRLMLVLLPLTTALAVEGGYLSTHNDWKGISHAAPSADQRAAESKARQEAIAKQIAELKQRLQRVPDKAKMDQLHAKLSEVHKAYGWVAEQGLVYGRRCIDPMLKGQDRLPENLLQAFIQLNKDFKARDIDLVVLPLVPTPHFASHLLVDGIDAEHEYYPGWTKMMIQMLENDIEIVDSVSEFRQHAADDTLVSWANDFHTGSLGRQLAARKLAERLQRYDFAQQLKGNVGKWKVSKKTKTGASLPQRILVVNGAFMNNGDYWMMKDKTLKKHVAKKKPFPEGMLVFKGKKTVAPRPGLPSDCIPSLKSRTFGYMTLNGPNEPGLRKTDLVMIGDSQLHSAVYGAGLPAFIMAETGGVFRWGSKSWSGFSPPDIYREVVPDGAVTPRVVVLAFLPKYFWHRYDRQGKVDEKASKYKPRPLPAVGAVAAKLPSGPFSCTVKVLQVPKKPTGPLDYDEALMHVAAKVTSGPLAGKEIGFRYWIMHGGDWTKADGKVSKGQELKLTLQSWSEVIKKDGSLRQHQTFGDTMQAATVPVFWVASGNLSAKELLK